MTSRGFLSNWNGARIPGMFNGIDPYDGEKDCPLQLITPAIAERTVLWNLNTSTS